MLNLQYYPLREDDFDKIIELGGEVHGENYLCRKELDKIYRKSVSRGLCCSFVAYEGSREQGQLVGFRLTYAPGLWEIDEWCTVEEWDVPSEEVCYFKSNTIRTEFRGLGVGSRLLERSKDAVRRMGGVAGVTHIWMQSPNNSAYRYFSKAGGKVIRLWPKRWAGDYEQDGYLCVLDGKDCVCDATEMILYLGEQDNE